MMKKTIKELIFTAVAVAILCCSFFTISISAVGETYKEDIYVYQVQDGNAQITTVLDWDMNGKNYAIPSTLGGYPVKTVSAVFACGMGPIFPESVDHIYFHEPYSDGSTMATEMLRVTILNPECKIEYESYNLNYNKDAVIIGYKGSTAEDFAKTYNKIFIDITKIKSEKGLSYIVENNEAQILWSDNGADGDLIIPDTLGGYPVTKISETAFANSLIKSVKIPDSVIEISDYAFGKCQNLASVKFSNNLKTIGSSAFMICRNLKSLDFPKSLEEIGNKAFCECGFSNIMIPENVKSIGILPFGCCDVRISVSESNGYFSTDDYGVLFNKDKTELIEYPYISDALGEYTVPDTVKMIDAYAFSSVKNLSAVIIPDGVERLGEFVFYYSEVSKVSIPGSVSEIPHDAFTNSDVRYIEMGEGIEKIADYAIRACHNLNTLSLPSSITTIGKGAFELLTQIEHIAIPENVTSIGENAFREMNSLKSVSVYNKNLSLDKVCDNTNGNRQLTFYGYKQSSAQKYASEQNYEFVSFFDGVDWAFYEGNLVISVSKEAAYLADGYLVCPWSQYADSTDVILLDNATQIGKGVFENFTNADIVIALGDSIHFYTDAFTNCNSLKTVVTFGNSVFEENAFINNNAQITYYTQADKTANIPSVSFSYDEESKTVTFDGDVTVTSNDFFNLMAAVCYGYGDKQIDKLRFKSFTAEDFQFIYYKSQYETIRKNTIEEAEFTVEIDSENGEKQQISFNELCEGIGNDEITKFNLVATDKDNSNFEDNEVGVGEQNIFVRWFKALIALLSRIFKIFGKK